MLWMSSGVNSASSSIFLKKSVSYGNLKFFNKVYLRYKNSSLYSFTISSKRSFEKSTRSILFTASTTCLMPNKETKKVCRRVCVITPVRASTRITARLAVEPPVIMLRVYCSCPGVSAIINFRLLVEKYR